MSCFGVCGTGLKQEEIDFNGHAALKGIYDNNLYWEFIALQDEYRDCIVWNKAFDTWYGDYEAVAEEILSKTGDGSRPLKK